MKNIFMKNKKIFFVILPLFIIVYFVYLAMFQLNDLVSLGVRIFTHGTMDIEKVVIKEGSSFKEGRIEIVNSQLYDKGELIADMPRVLIDYANMKIDRINIYSPKAVLVRKNSDINFVTVFVGESEDEKADNKREQREQKEREEKKKKKESNPILKRINVYDAQLEYRDISYSNVISQNVENVNGYVQFEKGYKVDLKFTGEKNREENQKEKYFYTFDNLQKSYDMRIRLENIEANDALIQYGYDSNGAIKNVSGLYNMDLRINDDGFFGYGKLENGNLTYEDLAVPIKDAELDLQFLGKQIKINGNYLFFDKRGNFSVEYNDGKGVDVDFDLKDVFFNQVASYKILADTGIKIDNFMLDDVNVNLSVKDDFKAQVDFKSGNGFKKGAAAISNVNGQLVYENGGIKLNNLSLNVKLDKEGKTIERDIKGQLEYKNDNGKVTVKVRSPREEFLSSIDLSFLFGVKKDGLEFKLNSDIIDLRGKYNFEEKKLSLNQKNNFEMIYDMAENHLSILKGYIDFSLEQYLVRTKFKTDDGYKIEIDSKLFNSDKKIKGSVKGYGDLKDKSYDFKMKADDINLKNVMGSIAGNAEGYVRGKGNNLNGEFLLDKFSVGIAEQNLNISDILGVITLEKERDLSVIFQGEIGKIKYAENEINGFKVSAKYSEDTVEILNAANKFLTLSGKYSIINSTMNLSLKGNDLNKEIINVSDINYNIEEVVGNISGKIDDLKGKFTVNNGFIDLGEDKLISFGGDVNYFKNKVYTDNFKINENNLSFEYFVDKKEGHYNVDIFESMLSEFVLGAKFRIIGVSSGTIKVNKVLGTFKGSVNEIYYKGSKIPNILFAGKYDNEKITFDGIDILSAEDEKLVSTKGIINIKEKNLDFVLDKQSVPIQKILEKEDVDGSINLAGKINGTFDNYNFELRASDGKILYKDVLIDKIGLNLAGNKEKATLENFTASYLNNSIQAKGEYNISENKYRFDVNSSDVDLKFLTVFLEQYGIDDISGNGKINLVISDIVPNGEVVLNNFNLSSKKYGLDLKNLNGDIILDKGMLKIEKFKGNLNNGDINLKGYFEAERAIKQLLGENFEKIDYNLSLEGKNITYSYEDYFNLNFDTKLNFRRNAVFGNVVINEGEISKIMNEDFGLVTIVKNFIRDFLRRNKSERMVLEGVKNFRGTSREDISDLRINVRFNIDKGINIKVNKATNFFTNIQGTIMGQGRLSGNLGKLNFLGETSIKDGEFALNGNKFTIDRAMILFNNRNEYIPDLNPDIVFSTNSIINNKNLEVTLTGQARNLTFIVKSGNEVSVNSLDSVLNGNGIGEDGSNNVSILFTNIIGGQISDIVINPIVGVLRTIGFSNLNVRSSILAEEKKKDFEDESTMNFGAYIEAESPIYKDKLFWKVKANFMNDTDNEETGTNRGSYGVADYDINVYNRINKNLSWGVGAQKLRENLETKKRDINYYIELKFEKKFDF